MVNSMKVIDQTHLGAKQYRGKWVALAHDQRTVVAVARTLRKAVALAKRAGVVDPIMTRVPTQDHLLVGLGT